jgi:putative membrane protein
VYLYAKIFHLVGMVSWMAGLFYLPRLFVYHAEAQAGNAATRDVLTAQYTIMQQRLLGIITTPAMLMTWLGGITMLVLNPTVLSQRWFVVKLVLLLALSGYHGWMSGVVRRLARNEQVMTSDRFRIMNEVPTVALVLIVTYAVLRDSVGLLFGAVIALVLTVLLGIGIQLYGVVRKRGEAQARSRT